MHQADDMGILAIEDMEHVDALGFTKVICANSRAHKLKQLTASSESDDFSWMVIQRRINSSQWSYLQRKPCDHFKSIGATTCLHKARDVMYWSTMNSEVKDFISNCTACNNYLKNNSKEPLNDQKQIPY